MPGKSPPSVFLPFQQYICQPTSSKFSFYAPPDLMMLYEYTLRPDLHSSSQLLTSQEFKKATVPTFWKLRKSPLKDMQTPKFSKLVLLAALVLVLFTHKRGGYPYSHLKAIFPLPFVPTRAIRSDSQIDSNEANTFQRFRPSWNNNKQFKASQNVFAKFCLFNAKASDVPHGKYLHGDVHSGVSFGNIYLWRVCQTRPLNASTSVQ